MPDHPHIEGDAYGVHCRIHGKTATTSSPSSPWPSCCACPEGTPSALVHYCDRHGPCTSVVDYANPIQPTQCWRCVEAAGPVPMLDAANHTLTTPAAQKPSRRLRLLRALQVLRLVTFLLAAVGVIIGTAQVLQWPGNPLRWGSPQWSWCVGVCSVYVVQRLLQMVRILREA